MAHRHKIRLTELAVRHILAGMSNSTSALDRWKHTTGLAWDEIAVRVTAALPGDEGVTGRSLQHIAKAHRSSSWEMAQAISAVTGIDPARIMDESRKVVGTDAAASTAKVGA